MAYCQRRHVERAAGGRDKLIALTDLDADGDLDRGALADAISAAEEWINSYVAKRRRVPLEPVPDIVRRTCAEEAVYRLRLGREALTDADQVRHEERRDWLAGIASGSISLGVDPPPPKSSRVMPAVGSRDDHPQAVTRKSLGGFA